MARSKALRAAPFIADYARTTSLAPFWAISMLPTAATCPARARFADAGDGSEEPTLDQIKTMMQVLRDQRPVPTPAVQFSGGEPTMRDDLPEIVALAREMGFAQIQVATNGIKLAASLALCRDLVRVVLAASTCNLTELRQNPTKRCGAACQAVPRERSPRSGWRAWSCPRPPSPARSASGSPPAATETPGRLGPDPLRLRMSGLAPLDRGPGHHPLLRHGEAPAPGTPFPHWARTSRASSVWLFPAPAPCP